jgi:hypothetical protein
MSPSIAATVTVIANVITGARGALPAWIPYSVLLPLAVLLRAGLYPFMLPHTLWWRQRGKA